MRIQTVNPSTGLPIQHYQTMTDKTIQTRLNDANITFHSWQETTFKTRKELMLKLASLLKSEANKCAALITQEMGKPIGQALNEIEKCAWVCEHYAQHAEQYLALIEEKTHLAKSLIVHEPIGVVFGIMPWNFPFWQVFRYAVPTLMAGNVALLKHAPISSGSACCIESLFKQAGFPDHVFQVLFLSNAGAARVIADERVAAVTLTGSERAGMSVAAQAGRYLKRVVLELGGSDPYLVLADADIEQAAKTLVAARLNNAGQSCISPKRIIVDQSILSEFTIQVEQLMQNYRMGDPLQSDVQIGPMARLDLRTQLHQQITQSIQKGAKLRLGGQIPAGAGFYYPPTLLSDVRPGMAAFDDELFGPVVSLIAANNEAEAIELANQSRFGLGGGVFTRDIERGKYIAQKKIITGSCFVNQCVASDPRLPFGGVKHSGLGRELGREGICQFVNIKTIGICA